MAMELSPNIRAGSKHFGTKCVDFWDRLVPENLVLEQVELVECVFLLDRMLAIFLVRKLERKSNLSVYFLG